MKQKWIIRLLLLAVSALTANAQTNIKKVELNGYLGKRVEQCITHHIMPQDVDHLIETFALRQATTGTRKADIAYGFHACITRMTRTDEREFWKESLN